MWIKHLEVNNVGCFASLKLDLSLGSICIVGPNGSGKSTLLNLVYTLLTDDWSRFPGLKMDCVRSAVKGSKDKSYVTGTVVHNGLEMSVWRGLRPNCQELHIKGEDEALTGATVINQRLEEILGVTKDMLSKFAFIAAERIYSFITDTPARRQDAFQVLCQTQHCEAVYDVLGAFLNQDVALHAQLLDNSDDLCAEEVRCRTEIIRLQAEYDTQAQFMLNATSLQAAKDILRRQQRHEDLLKEQAEVTAAVAVASRSYAVAQRAAENAEIQATEAHAAEVAALAEVESKRDLQQAWLAYDAYVQRWQRLRGDAKALHDEVRLRVRPTPPLEGTDTETWQRDLVDLCRALETAQKQVSTFGRTGKAVCPLCGQDVPNEDVIVARHVVTTYPARIESLKQRVADAKDYESKVLRHEHWLAGYTARQEANVKALADLPVCAKPAGSRAELQAVLKKQQQLASIAAAALRIQHDTAHELAACAARVEERQQRLDALGVALQATVESPERCTRARARLAEHTTAETIRAGLAGQLQQLRVAQARATSELKTLRQRLRQQRRVRAMANIIAQVRDVFHRDGLPLTVATANLAAMEGDVNAGLALFGSPFWVEADNSLNFIAHKPGETPQPASWLSTGQKVVLAIPFWDAVGSLWKSGVGMLALDEPTANLDEGNRRFLVEALGRMTARVRGQRQLLMVTHDRSLCSAFDQVVDLTGGV